MTRRNKIATERFRFIPEIAKLEFFIAHHAWVWRATGLILARKIIDHEILELIGFIDHVMGKTQRLRDTARVGHGLWPATFVGRARDAILRPDFHRHPDDIVIFLTQQKAGDARVDSAAHAEKDALFLHLEAENVR